MNGAGQPQRQKPPANLLQAAADFLRHDSLILEPRCYWPRPVLSEVKQAMPFALEHFDGGKLKLVIPVRLRASEGRALCLYGDAGWGQEVARGKYQSGRFGDSLAVRAAELFQG